MSKTKIFTFLLILLTNTFIFEACQKETQKDIQPQNTELSYNKQSKVSVNEANTSVGQAMTDGGNTDAVLSNIEEELNSVYGVPDQSIGQVSLRESELTVASQNGTIEQAQAQQIYNAALSSLSQNYYGFASPTKQALLVDLEIINTEATNVKVKISTWVGETQSLGATVGCSSNFTAAKYYWSSLYPQVAPPYGDLEMTKKFNQKAAINLCQYVVSPKTFNLYAIDTKQWLTAAELNDAYCNIEQLIQNTLSQNPGYALISTDIKGKALTGGGGVFKFTGNYVIGIKKKKKNCGVVDPPFPSDPEVQ